MDAINVPSREADDIDSSQGESSENEYDDSGDDDHAHDVDREFMNTIEKEAQEEPEEEVSNHEDPSILDDGYSHIQAYGDNSSACGYCKKSQHTLYGVWAHRLEPLHYQKLIDGGWRRSGKYLYKPHNVDACCQQIPIRLKADLHEMGKSQRKVARKWNRCAEETYSSVVKKTHEKLTRKDSMATSQPVCIERKQSDLRHTPPATEYLDILTVLRPLVRDAAAEFLPPDEVIKDDILLSVRRDAARVEHHQGYTMVPFASRLAFHVTCPSSAPKVSASDQIRIKKEIAEKKASKVAGQMANARKILDKLGDQIVAVSSDAKVASELSSESKLTRTYVQAWMAGETNRFRVQELEVLAPGFVNIVVMVPSVANGGVEHPPPLHRNESLPKAAKGEHGVNSSGEAKQSPAPSAFASKPSNLSISLHPSAYVADEFQLYKKYQDQIHGKDEDGTTAAGYKRFLVDSPFRDPNPVPASFQGLLTDLVNVELRTLSDRKAKGAASSSKTSHIPKLALSFGSYHVRYCLEGRLVAVGVIDILPVCVSSVYVFYDPDIMILSPGVYSALWEIALVHVLSQSIESIQYYYLGFYIHSCKKMRYKANFRPSQLLCEETGLWVDFEQAKLVLDTKEKGSIRLTPNSVPCRSRTEPSEEFLQRMEIRLFQRDLQLGDLLIEPGIYEVVRRILAELVTHSGQQVALESRIHLR